MNNDDENVVLCRFHLALLLTEWIGTLQAMNAKTATSIFQNCENDIALDRHFSSPARSLGISVGALFQRRIMIRVRRTYGNSCIICYFSRLCFSLKK
jgi:hypothetical protein